MKIPSHPAVLIKVGEEPKPVPPPRTGVRYTLHELYELLHCNYVEVVGQRGNVEKWQDWILIVDEDAKLLLKPINETATDWLWDCRAATVHEVIAGDALLCRKDLFFA